MATVTSFPLTTVPLADALAAASYDLHKATSTTSLAIGTGAKVFTTQADKGFVAGDFVAAISDADHANYMYGTVTTYSGTTLTLDVTEVGGSGTLADWTVRTSGPPGNTGATGATGAGYAATSVTSNAIASSGSKTFATQAGLAYAAGARVRASDAAAPTVNWMEGVVTSYSGTSLIFTADKSLGSGTLTSWTINVAGQPGADGLGTGDFSSNTATSVDGEAVVFSGTGGKTGRRFSLTGLIKSASGVLAAAVAGTDYMHPGTTSLVTVGFTITPLSLGTVSSGTTTPAAAGGNYQYYSNNGAHTLAAPTADCAIDIMVTNAASAGSITFSGFTVGSVTGSALTTTNGHRFLISIRRINAISTYSIYALQ